MQVFQQKSDVSDSTKGCYTLPDVLDVTNYFELVLFIIFFTVAFFLTWKVFKNWQKLKHNEFQNRMTKRVTKINQFTLVVLICEILQKLHQIIFGIIFISKKPVNGNKDFAFVQIDSQIYFVVTATKIFLLYGCITYISRVCFKSTKHEVIWQSIKAKKFQENGYALLIALLPISYISVIVLYFLGCDTNSYVRNMIMLCTTVLVFSVFVYAIYLFYKKIARDYHCEPNFKRKVKNFTIFLYVGVIVRCLYYILITFTEVLNSIKQIDSDKPLQNSHFWIIFLVFYQPLVSLIPLWLITEIFQPNQQQIESRQFSESGLME